MKRKKPVLKCIIHDEMETDGEFRKILELGLLLALKERGILAQYQLEERLL